MNLALVLHFPGVKYSTSDYWSDDKFRLHQNKFYNVATTFGRSHLRDMGGKELYLHCLDIDSEEVLNRVLTLLEQWKAATFVIKTQKDCGYHVYWFEHSDVQDPILKEYCKKGCEFEIKCGKALCTLPPSRHRDNPFFHYENVGQGDKIMIADGLYGNLVNDLLKDCLKKKSVKSRKNVRTTNSIDLVPKLEVTANCNVGIETSENVAKRIVLSTEQIEKSVHHLLPYYCEGTRDKFVFGFSGFAYKEDIGEESASKILGNICIRTNDAEKNSRLRTLHRTYVNGLENGLDGIIGKTKLKEVIAFVSNCDERACQNVIENLLKIWHGNNEKKQSDLAKELAAENIDNPVEYTISVINKTVKCDNSLVRANLYAGLSTYTLDPMNLVIAAPTSEGKTYTVLQTLQYFPSEDVKYIGSMSPKVIIRQNSILVDPHTLKPVMEDIRALKKQIEQEKDKERNEDLKSQLEELKSNACLLIDLRKKVYVFLEPPDPDLWAIIKPIMSHDSFVMEHPYVDSNSRNGIHVKRIITIGFPTFIFCTAKDESKWEQWDEVVSRSLVMSPNMSIRKYREATVLNAQLLGIPSAIQESLLRSKREEELAKKCVCNI